MEMQDVPRMTSDELYARMAQGEAVVILDVRTKDALTVKPEQIPGARLMPLADVVQQANTLPRQRTIVTYCTWLLEASSARAAQWLREEGFEDVYVLKGGLDAWLQGNYAIVPVTTGSSSVRALEAAKASTAPPAPNAPGMPAVHIPVHTNTFLAGLAQQYAAEQHAPRRKELTVLFVDIADSTATVLNQSPEVTLAVVQHFMGIVTEIALAYCGDVKDYEGDGALLYFESVSEATEAAVAIRNALANAQPEGHAPLRARISLNVGSIIVGVVGSALRRSIALIGPSIYIAFRLLKHIPPGGIIATEALVQRLRQEAPAFAQQFEVWDQRLVLKGVEEEYVSAFHLP